MCALQGYKLDEKSLGKRSALNAHAAFDEAGGGNMIEKALMRHCSILPVRCLKVKLRLAYSANRLIV
jgi:hypothetical protein